MKNIDTHDGDFVDSLTERAIAALYPFHAFILDKEKKARRSSKVCRSEVNRRNKYQVPGH